MQDPRVSDQGANEHSRITNVSDPDGRKRRRLSLNNLVTEHMSINKDVQAVGMSLPRERELPPEVGAWDHLAKWVTPNDTLVGDTDDEEHYLDTSDVSSEGAKESGDEAEETRVPAERSKMRLSKLNAEQVIEVINSCIRKYEQAWTPGKDETQYKNSERLAEVPVVYDPLSMWEKAEADGQREKLAMSYESEAAYYRQRLDKLCDEIIKDPGDTVAAVQKKCRNLEVTVDLVQRATWLEDIYRLPPTTSSDDESEEETSGITNRVRSPITRWYGPVRHHGSASHAIDLSTPSDSESENVLVLNGLKSNQISTKPIQAEVGDHREQRTFARILTSDSIVIDTIDIKDSVPASSSVSVHSRVPLEDAPEQASLSRVRRWSWTLLEETQDRKRAVSKAIYELSSTDKDTIRHRLQRVDRASVVREILACVDMLSRGATRMSGILPQDLAKIVTFTRLFICWWLCGNYCQKEPSKLDLIELRESLERGSRDPSVFCNYVDTVLQTTFSHKALRCPAKPSQAEIIEISDDDELPARSNTA